RCGAPHPFSAPSGLLDLPRCIMRNVHRVIAARPSQRRHCITSKWLVPSDPCIFAGATRDDMAAATHVWLRLVDVAGIEGRENLVSVSVGQNTGSIDVLLGTRVDAQRGAARRHLVEHLFSLHVLRGAHRLQQCSRAETGDLEALHWSENEVSHVGRGSLLFDRIGQDDPGSNRHQRPGKDRCLYKCHHLSPPLRSDFLLCESKGGSYTAGGSYT